VPAYPSHFGHGPGRGNPRHREIEFLDRVATGIPVRGVDRVVSQILGHVDNGIVNRIQHILNRVKDVQGVDRNVLGGLTT